MRRALIVDADPIARNRMLNALISIRPSLIVCAEGTLLSARRRIKQWVPHLIIADFYLKDGSGLQLLEQVRGLAPRAPRLIFSQNSDSDHVSQAFRVGVDGYLLKTETDQSLRQSLRSFIRGDPALSAEITRLMMGIFKTTGGIPDGHAAPVAVKSARQAGLTQREAEVLMLLAKGFDRHQVGESLAIRASTVAGHIKSIYLKLNVTSRAQATLAAVNMGLVQVTEAEQAPASSMLP